MKLLPSDFNAYAYFGTTLSMDSSGLYFVVGADGAYNDATLGCGM
jgi:hypothetical protein